MAIMASGVKRMGVASHKGNSGPSTDAVQEETGELGYYPVIDIIFHENPFVVFYEQAGLRVSRSDQSGQPRVLIHTLLFIRAPHDG